MWWARLLNVIAGLHGIGVAASTNSYESIATTTVGAGGSATITFSSIPSTYKHLQIRGIARSSTAATYGYMTVTFNSDSASNYSWHYLEGSGTAASASAATSQPYMVIESTTAASLGANIFGAFVADILDYADTNKYKTLRELSGSDGNGSGYVDFASGNWRSTSAVNSISISLNAGNFVQYSQIALYGIKG